MKFFKNPINYFRNNQLITPLFLMLLLISSCGSADPGFKYNVTFISPIASSIYYTDTYTVAGESLEGDTVEIKAEIEATTELGTLSLEIRNSSLQLVQTENFENAEGLLNYTMETTFKTNVVDTYNIQVISTYGYGQNYFIRVFQGGAFEYRNIEDDNGGDDNGGDDNGGDDNG